MSGVCGHSMPVQPGNYVIFAAVYYTPRHVEDGLSHAGVKYKVLGGCFEGVEEVSYIVHEDDWLKCEQFAEFEKAFLWLGPYETHGNRPAFIVKNSLYAEPSIEFSGMFSLHSVGKKPNIPSWTYDNGNYYSISPFVLPRTLISAVAGKPVSCITGPMPRTPPFPWQFKERQHADAA